MITIKDVLKEKGGEYFFVKPDVFVFEALKIMVANNVGSILIIDGGKVVGIFTERDYLRKKVLDNLSTKNTKIKDAMTKDPLTIQSDLVCAKALKIMTDKRCRHLPVVDDGKVVGLVSIGDLVSKKLKEQEEEINNLNNYFCND